MVTNEGYLARLRLLRTVDVALLPAAIELDEVGEPSTADSLDLLVLHGIASELPMPGGPPLPEEVHADLLRGFEIGQRLLQRAVSGELAVPRRSPEEMSALLREVVGALRRAEA